MKNYNVLFLDGHSEIVDFDTVDKLIDELEMFERCDVNQIHVLNPDGSLGDTIWTEEEGLFVGNFGCDEEDDDEEYYEDPSELFNFDKSNVIELVKDVIDELDFESLEDRNRYLKMKHFLKHPEMWDELKEMSVDRVCDSDTIWDYINSYSISELGDMDGIWNEFGDILHEVIDDYFENYFEFKDK